jgi:hypothetical protein
MDFDIENYLNSLPENIEEIDVSGKNLKYLPDLLRFKKLKRPIHINYPFMMVVYNVSILLFLF